MSAKCATALEPDLFGHFRFAAGGRSFFLRLRFGASFGDSWNASLIALPAGLGKAATFQCVSETGGFALWGMLDEEGRAAYHWCAVRQPFCLGG